MRICPISNTECFSNSCGEFVCQAMDEIEEEGVDIHDEVTDDEEIRYLRKHTGLLEDDFA